MNGVMPVSLGMIKVFLLTGKRPVLVDTGTRGNASRILDGLNHQDVKPEDVGLILITHTHGDHIGSLAELKKAIPAPVAVHRLDAESVRADACVEPDVLLEDESDLRPCGVAGEVIWTPGHSRGSVLVTLESGEAIVGDLVLPRFMAFGPPAIAFWSASREDSIASINKVIAFRPSTILASHGGPYTPESLVHLARS
ncbi:MBL fold metallo-hydrolase [candidate division WOR-3 bacterium]|uniref:MBL fold metallo-hydrolase n=1 Tax=candidate division WOR-3 bacterium TaxID=2052148 RepID=A0A937XHM3_UNCW3|nr:MBL fold metallo-hydrolase [candidate division WOR-3 bacterium]